MCQGFEIKVFIERNIYIREKCQNSFFQNIVGKILNEEREKYLHTTTTKIGDHLW